MRLKLSLIWLICLLYAGCKHDSQNSSAERQENARQMQDDNFDWQGHRGARGLLPENTVPAFLLALEFPKLTTLELDLAVSKDKQLIVSHEPWLSHDICSWPDGRPVEEQEEDQLAIFQMPAATLKQYDCGNRGNKRFPDQKAMKTYKPLLAEVVTAAEERAKELGRKLPFYNMEIKSRPEWDGTKSPEPADFARLLLAEVERLGIKDRTCIQSFDTRALEAVHAQAPEVVTAYLVEELDSLEENLNKLSFTPTIYSPYYMLVTGNMVKQIHERGMQIIPWTVNDTENMAALKALGVDGIITDYPDRIP